MVKASRATSRQELADRFVIAAPTPFNVADRSPNLNYVDPGRRERVRERAQIWIGDHDLFLSGARQIPEISIAAALL
jgi:hypothetical protein